MSPRCAGLLTVDCGNSTADCLDHTDGSRLCLDSTNLDVDRLKQWIDARAIDRCVLASVVVDAGRILREVLTQCLSQVRVAGVDLPCPLRLEYSSSSSVGVDRWLGALAAWRTHGQSIVVDCGSATTVNLVTADGRFRGGCIAPGLRAFGRGMAAVTPGLPPPQLTVTPTLPATDTQSSVDAGVLLGYCGMVEKLVAGCAVSLQPHTLVLTGGVAPVVRRLSQLQGEFQSDLVHQGMRILLVGA